MLLRAAKARSKKRGLMFTLVREDIEIPEFCPVLGIRLQVGYKAVVHSSPTIDRLIPQLGYVRSNIRVISFRANTIRGDATSEELEAVAAYAKSVETSPTASIYLRDEVGIEYDNAPSRYDDEEIECEF
jgi:hypothetical protein